MELPMRLVFDWELKISCDSASVVFGTKAFYMQDKDNFGNVSYILDT